VVSTRPKKKLTVYREPGPALFRAPEKATITRYSRLMTRFLGAYARSGTDGHLYHFTPTKDQKGLLDSLFRRLQRGESKPKIRETLQQLIIRLFEPCDVRNENSRPISLFFCYTALREDSSFDPATLVTPRMAAIQWGVRAAALAEIDRLVKSGQSPSLDRFVLLYRFVLTLTSSRSAIQKVNPMVSNNVSSPFTSLRHSLAYASTVAYATPSLPNVTWTDDAGSELSFQGETLKMSELKALPHAILLEARKVLDDELMFGLGSEFHIQLDARTTVHDNPNRTDARYSFFTDPANQERLFDGGLSRRSLLRALMNHERKPLHGRAGDHIRFAPDRCIQYEASCHRLLALIFTLDQMTSGQPARITEKQSFRVANSETESRNLYFMAGRLVTMTSHHKGKNAAGLDRLIPRAFAWEVASLFLDYWVYVRPVQQAYLSDVFPTAQPQLYITHLYVSRGSALSADSLGQAMRRVTGHHLPFSIGASHWRHMAIAIMRRHLMDADCWNRFAPLHDDDEEGGGSDVWDLQAAHSTVTARRIYGRQTDWMKAMDALTLQEFLHCSDVTHAWFGLHPRLPGSAPPSSQPRIARATAASAVGPRPALGQAISSLELTIKQSIRQYVGEAFASVRASSVMAGELAGGGRDGTAVPVSLLHALRRHLKNETASFKSAEQALAVHIARLRQSPLLVVLPTGGGKSLVYTLLAAELEKDGLTMVISPFVALMQDQLQRRNTSDLAFQWKASMASQVLTGLGFVSMEEAVQPSFCTFLSINLPTLRRVVMDEAHLVLTDSSYRPSLHGLPGVFSRVKAPVVALSATLSPQFEPALADKIGAGGGTIRVVRGKTNRPEIAYFVHHPRLVVGVDPTLLQAAATLVRETLVRRFPDGRGVLYFRTVSDCEIASRDLQCPLYHSRMTSEARQDSFDSFAQGSTPRYICATTALGVGVDIPGIRWTLHVDEPYDITSFAQQTGRAGRDGVPAECHVLLAARPYYAPSVPGECDFAGREPMRRWLDDVDTCRRELLSTFLDGAVVTCASLPSASLCDVCTSVQRTPPPNPAPSDPGVAVVIAHTNARFQQLAAQGRIEVLLGYLKALKHTCVACWAATGTVGTPHTLAQCSKFAGASFFSSSGEFVRWRGVIRWPEGVLCYTCAVPIEYHAKKDSDGTQHCRYSDIILPALYIAYVHAKALLADALRLDDVCDNEPLVGEKAFARWLCRMSHSASIPNSVLAFNSFAKQQGLRGIL